MEGDFLTPNGKVLDPGSRHKAPGFRPAVFIARGDHVLFFKIDVNFSLNLGNFINIEIKALRASIKPVIYVQRLAR